MTRDARQNFINWRIRNTHQTSPKKELNWGGIQKYEKRSQPSVTPSRCHIQRVNTFWHFCLFSAPLFGSIDSEIDRSFTCETKGKMRTYQKGHPSESQGLAKLERGGRSCGCGAAPKVVAPLRAQHGGLRSFWNRQVAYRTRGTKVWRISSRRRGRAMDQSESLRALRLPFWSYGQTKSWSSRTPLHRAQSLLR